MTDRECELADLAKRLLAWTVKDEDRVYQEMVPRDQMSDYLAAVVREAERVLGVSAEEAFGIEFKDGKYRKPETTP